MHFKYYRPQTKFAKVMFSQVSVCCLSNGGLCRGGVIHPKVGGVSVQGGLCPRGVIHPNGGGSLSKGGSLSRGSPYRESLSKGVYV